MWSSIPSLHSVSFRGPTAARAALAAMLGIALGAARPYQSGVPDSPSLAVHHSAVVTVKMVLNSQGMRFDPSNVVVNKGDVIKFVNVSGGPHNVAFVAAKIPAAAKAPLAAAMPNQFAPLAGQLISAPNGTYTISFANIPAGSYPFFCTPHLAMGMTGTITVK
jgi:plastocyanin